MLSKGYRFSVHPRTQYQAQKRSLDIQVSLDGRHFAPGEFPPNMRPDQHVSLVVQCASFVLITRMLGIHNPRIQHEVSLLARYYVGAASAILGQHLEVELQRNVLWPLHR